MNMSYCRFHNTLMDLRDCQENMDAGDLSEEEKDARAELIDVCWRIAQDWANEKDEEDEAADLLVKIISSERPDSKIEIRVGGIMEVEK